MASKKIFEPAALLKVFEVAHFPLVADKVSLNHIKRHSTSKLEFRVQLKHCTFLIIISHSRKRYYFLGPFVSKLVNYSRHSEFLNILRNFEIDDIFVR